MIGQAANCVPAEHPPSRLAWLFAGVVLIAALVSSIPGPAPAQTTNEYRLGVQDKLQIRIGRWRSTDGVYESWEGVGGEHVVAADGRVFVAVAGSVPAKGRTMSALAEDISQRIQLSIGMDQAPAVSIEIIEYRPIYVAGAVNAPGEFKYRPEMTVLQAIALAGGHLRTTSPSVRPQREITLAARDYEVLALRKWRLIARLARLKAQLDGTATIEMPKKLVDIPDAEKLLEVEETILSTSLKATNSKNESIDQLAQLLTATIESLDEEIALRQQQLKIANVELAKVQQLVKKGLSVSAREATARTSVTDLEATLISLKVAKLTAEQKLNEAAREKLDLASEQRRLIVTESLQLREELDQVEVKLEAAKALVTEAAGLSGQATQAADKSPPVYRLSRSEDGKMTTRDVGQNEPLRPGDTLQVIAPDPTLSLN